MRKIIAAFNMTLDGVCDHRAGIADKGLHNHYTDLIENAGMILYGRTTYELMQFWQTLLGNPSGDQAMDDFAIAIDTLPKLVFSSTLKSTGWHSAELASRSLVEEVLQRKQQSGKDILVGSRSLIIQLLNQQLIDELQLCIHPVIEGGGLRLFDQVQERTVLQFKKTKALNSGAAVFYYKPLWEKTTNR